MTSILSRLVRLAPLALLPILGAAARADTITLADGKVLENVTVTNETLKEVTFKQEGKSKNVPSDTVVSVTRSRK